MGDEKDYSKQSMKELAESARNMKIKPYGEVKKYLEEAALATVKALGYDSIDDIKPKTDNDN